MQINSSTNYKISPHSISIFLATYLSERQLKANDASRSNHFFVGNGGSNNSYFICVGLKDDFEGASKC
jgi:hypothetical protein